ncbi:MAG TPA: AAA family ATPase, partial [Candidatus Fimicola cottocaccae]|nr:AAA family ATPase [Candidatus Fimicola cottocaccae]
EKNISEIFNIDVAVGGRIAEMSRENIINIKNEKEKNYRLNFV